jgi:hypothetical protein
MIALKLLLSPPRERCNDLLDAKYWQLFMIMTIAQDRQPVPRVHHRDKLVAVLRRRLEEVHGPGGDKAASGVRLKKFQKVAEPAQEPISHLKCSMFRNLICEW